MTSASQVYYIRDCEIFANFHLTFVSSSSVYARLQDAAALLLLRLSPPCVEPGPGRQLPHQSRAKIGRPLLSRGCGSPSARDGSLLA